MTRTIIHLHLFEQLLSFTINTLLFLKAKLTKAVHIRFPGVVAPSNHHLWSHVTIGTNFSFCAP